MSKQPTGMALTDVEVRGLKPKTHPFRFLDHDGAGVGTPVTGFGVQVSPGGKKSFFLRYQSPTRQKRRFLSLGIWPEKSLAAARKDAQRMRVLIGDKIDPSDERDETIAAKVAAIAAQERADRAGTVRQMFELYVKDMKDSGKSSYKNVWSAYMGNIDKAIGDQLANTIDARRLVEVIGAVYARGSHVMANRVRAYLISGFRFGLSHDLNPKFYSTRHDVSFDLKYNPARDIPKPTVEKPGERYLSAAEIQRLWKVLDNRAFISPSIANLLRMALASGGQRMIELLRATEDQFDLDKKIWNIPPGNTKNSRAHVVPFGSVFAKLYQDQRTDAASEWLFPKRTNLTEHLETSSVGSATAKFCKESGFPKFCPRDLRRTVKTGMGEIGISKEYRDRLQNHALTDVSSKHYDRYDYLREKRRAMNDWDRLLTKLLY